MPTRHPSRWPTWARWSEAAAASPWTIGLEEEIMLLDPREGSPANRIAEVLDVLPPALARHASAETHACVLELRTSPHATQFAAADLARAAA